MNTFISRLSIRQILLIQGSAVVILFSVAAFGFILPEMNRCMAAREKDRLKKITEVGIGILTVMNDRCVRGEMSLFEGKKQAAAMIRNLRYGPQDGEFFWINDFSPTIVVHPYRTDLEGTDAGSITDTGGKRVFVETAKTCSLHGEGFADYTWSSKSDNPVVTGGVTFFKAYRPWGWIIGTGYLADNPGEGSLAVYGKAVLIFLVIAGVSLFIMFASSGLITNPIKKTSSWLRKGIDGKGDLTISFDVPPGKELGEFTNNFNEFRESIHRMVKTVKETSERLFESAQIIQLSSESSAGSTEKQAASSMEIKALSEKVSEAMEKLAGRLEEHLAGVQIVMTGIKALPVNGLELEKTIEETKHTSGKISILSEQEILRLKGAEAALEKNEMNKAAHITAMQQAENQLREIGRAAASVDLLVRLVSEKVKYQALSVTDIGQRITRIMSNADGIKSTIGEQQTAVRKIGSSIDGLAELADTSADNAAAIAGNAEEIKGLSYRLTSEAQKFRV